MPILLGIPIIALAVILQSTLLSRITLLSGTADLVLLIVACWAMQEGVEDEWAWAIIAGLLAASISALPVWLPLAGYLSLTALAIYLKKRVWQIPLLALVLVVFSGTLLIDMLTFVTLRITGSPIEFGQALNLIILPGILLNLLLALPVNAVVGEIAGWLYPGDQEA